MVKINKEISISVKKKEREKKESSKFECEGIIINNAKIVGLNEKKKIHAHRNFFDLRGLTRAVPSPPLARDSSSNHPVSR